VEFEQNINKGVLQLHNSSVHQNGEMLLEELKFDVTACTLFITQRGIKSPPHPPQKKESNK
jgi:hypothetical protein